MSGNEVRLRNGQYWTKQDFLDYYRRSDVSGTPVPVGPSPVPVDMSWYMGEGPGRYYHPGMFQVVRNLISKHNLTPGTYDLWDMVPRKEKDPSVTASISHYFTDGDSDDYKTRALVFGKESARISGQVVVNPDGSKTFNQIEIRPFDTNFDFEAGSWNPLRDIKAPITETARAAARKYYDPENFGISYEIPYRGTGRFYHPFSDAQLGAALRDAASAPPGLLPSYTLNSSPDDHSQYIDQPNSNQVRPTNGGDPMKQRQDVPAGGRNPVGSRLPLESIFGPL